MIDDELGWPPSRRVVLLGIAGLALLVAVIVVLHVTGAADAFSTITKDAGDWAYLAVFLSVFFDAIIPIFPSETALSAASALAADGSLRLDLVIAAGAAAAILGDSSLYWIARLTGRRLQPQIEKAKQHEKVVLALQFMGSSAPLLIVAGRYIPRRSLRRERDDGHRRVPVPQVPALVALGSVLWASYTCALAYVVSTTLKGFPLASVVISGFITTIAIGVIYLVVRRNRRRRAELSAPAV